MCNKKIWLLIVTAFTLYNMQAIVDNRFRDFSLSYHPFLAEQTYGAISIQPFLEKSHHSYNQFGKEVGLFDYGTSYRLRELDKALIVAGKTSATLIPTNMQGLLTEGAYCMEGSFEIQGLGCNVYVPLHQHCAFGARSELIHVNSRMELIKDKAFDLGVSAGPGDDNEIVLLQEKIHKTLGLEPVGCWSAYMVGDTELYARFFTELDYRYRCRFIDMGITFGVVVPFAQERNKHYPSSISCGGERHWGLFIEGNADIILKQSLRVGCNLRLQNRFSREARIRVPVGQEPSMFGAYDAPINLNPGLTVAFSCYFLKEELRDGLGGFLGLSCVKHRQDTYSDKRHDAIIPVNFNNVCQESSWGRCSITGGLLYDFGVRDCGKVITLRCDVPVDFLLTERSSKTYGLALITELSF